jgi:hypothetical protein
MSSAGSPPRSSIRVWDLLEKPDRSAADDDEMLHGAHASRYH